MREEEEEEDGSCFLLLSHSIVSPPLGRSELVSQSPWLPQWSDYIHRPSPHFFSLKSFASRWLLGRLSAACSSVCLPLCMDGLTDDLHMIVLP